jgi:lipid-binding SYLF domain-containing protein
MKQAMTGFVKAVAAPLGLLVALTMSAVVVLAADESVREKDAATIKTFRQAGAGAMLDGAHGYAVFPTIGKGGIGIGGAHGSGHVYEKGKAIGETKMTQITYGFQLGGQAYSQLILFEDKRALDEFISGNFEFGAQATAVALTAAAGAEAGGAGAGTNVSAGKNDADVSSGGYKRGMAIFTIVKGGLMYEATLGGQKFSYAPF